jgi:pyruvate dehydrogenase E1 component alpha subunit
MITKLTKEDLIAFETDIAATYDQGKIRAPIHLQSNCFDQLIEIFTEVKEEDWIFGTWRFHAESLLKGVSKDLLKSSILQGKSISLCFPEKRIFSSAIVTGTLPIAVGAALSIKRNKSKEKVWAFLGDMASLTGMFWECLNYSQNFKLPITFVIADNGKSVCTNTRNTFGCEKLLFEPQLEDNICLVNYNNRENEVFKSEYIYYYKYNLSWPHAGSGKRIQF